MLESVSTGGKEIVSVNKGVHLFFGNSLSPCSPVIGDGSEFDTSQYFGLEFVSLGTGYETELDGNDIIFKDKPIFGYSEFSSLNLFSCKYLNLSGSSF